MLEEPVTATVCCQTSWRHDGWASLKCKLGIFTIPPTRSSWENPVKCIVSTDMTESFRPCVCVLVLISLFPYYSSTTVCNRACLHANPGTKQTVHQTSIMGLARLMARMRVRWEVPQCTERVWHRTPLPAMSSFPPPSLGSYRCMALVSANSGNHLAVRLETKTSEGPHCHCWHNPCSTSPASRVGTLIAMTCRTLLWLQCRE